MTLLAFALEYTGCTARCLAMDGGNTETFLMASSTANAMTCTGFSV
jgi:hypothetical protein